MKDRQLREMNEKSSGINEWVRRILGVTTDAPIVDREVNLLTELCRPWTFVLRRCSEEFRDHARNHCRVFAHYLASNLPAQERSTFLEPATLALEAFIFSAVDIKVKGLISECRRAYQRLDGLENRLSLNLSGNEENFSDIVLALVYYCYSHGDSETYITEAFRKALVSVRLSRDGRRLKVRSTRGICHLAAATVYANAGVSSCHSLMSNYGYGGGQLVHMANPYRAQIVVLDTDKEAIVRSVESANGDVVLLPAMPTVLRCGVCVHICSDVLCAWADRIYGDTEIASAFEGAIQRVITRRGSILAGMLGLDFSYKRIIRYSSHEEPTLNGRKFAFYSDNGHESSGHHDTGRVTVKNCYVSVPAYVTCGDCGDEHDSCDSTQISGNWICGDCLENYFRCFECEEYCHESCCMYSEQTGHDYCDGCYGILHDYCTMCDREVYTAGVDLACVTQRNKWNGAIEYMHVCEDCFCDTHTCLRCSDVYMPDGDRGGCPSCNDYDDKAKEGESEA